MLDGGESNQRSPVMLEATDLPMCHSCCQSDCLVMELISRRR